jgi:hypothetical protein
VGEAGAPGWVRTVYLGGSVFVLLAGPEEALLAGRHRAAEEVVVGLEA